MTCVEFQKALGWRDMAQATRGERAEFIAHWRNCIGCSNYVNRLLTKISPEVIGKETPQYLKDQCLQDWQDAEYRETILGPTSKREP